MYIPTNIIMARRFIYMSMNISTVMNIPMYILMKMSRRFQIILRKGNCRITGHIIMIMRNMKMIIMFMDTGNTAGFFRP